MLVNIVVMHKKVFFSAQTLIEESGKKIKGNTLHVQETAKTSQSNFRLMNDI